MPAIEIPEVTDLEVAFSTTKGLPKWEDIPNEFKNGRTKWNDLFSEWFFRGGLKSSAFVPKPGVDRSKALRHLKAVMGSYEPKHEHKESGFAYLMSQYFEDYREPSQATEPASHDAGGQETQP